MSQDEIQYSPAPDIPLLQSPTCVSACVVLEISQNIFMPHKHEFCPADITMRTTVTMDTPKYSFSNFSWNKEEVREQHTNIIPRGKITT